MSENIQDPINAFPERLQHLIYHYSEAKGYSTDFFIAAMIGAISTAAGRAVTLNTGAFSAMPCMWVIILGLRGKTKSEPLDDAFEPITNLQFRILDRYRADQQELEHYKAQNPKDKSVQELAPMQTMLMNDTTPEKLVMSLAANPKGIGIVYDELAGFIKRFNRYNAGADEEMYLSLFNGGSVMRERLSGINAYARRTYLSITGSTQPNVLKEVFLNKVGNGFFDRWLICSPPNTDKPYPSAIGINKVEKEFYHDFILTICALGYEEGVYNQMSYTQSSYDIIYHQQKLMIDEENQTDNDDIRGILAKMEIYLHRFAILLQICEYGVSQNVDDLTKVSVRSAEGAVILIKYFIDQTLKVRIASPVDKLPHVWGDIYKKLPPHGKPFDRKFFVDVCNAFDIKERAADKFLKEHAQHNDQSLFFKVKHGMYTKNLF